MEDVLKILIDMSNKLSFARVRRNQKICLTAAYVFHVSLRSDGGGLAACMLFNGESMKDPAMFDLMSKDDHADTMTFIPPLYFDRGIYVNVGAHTQSVIVHYYIKPKRRKKRVKTS